MLPALHGFFILCIECYVARTAWKVERDRFGTYTGGGTLMVKFEVNVLTRCNSNLILFAIRNIVADG